MATVEEIVVVRINCFATKYINSWRLFPLAPTSRHIFKYNCLVITNYDILQVVAEATEEVDQVPIGQVLQAQADMVEVTIPAEEEVPMIGGEINETLQSKPTK